MTEDRITAGRADPGRQTHRALAALREAAESLEELIAAGGTPNVPVAAAASHVAAARAVLKPQLFGSRPDAGGWDRNAA